MKRRTPRLSRERIVECAVDYVERHCLSDLSMRRLGSELGVEAMSLYRYFPSKAALFEAIVDVTVARIATRPSGATDWESAVRAYAHSFRDAAREDPGLFPLLLAAARTHPGVQALMERMLSMWRGTGLDQEMSRQAQCAVHAFTMGTVTAELGSAFGPAFAFGPASGAGEGASADHGGRGECRDHTPGVHLATTAPPVAPGENGNASSADAEFEFCLDVLVEGLRARVSERTMQHHPPS